MRQYCVLGNDGPSIFRLPLRHRRVSIAPGRNKGIDMVQYGIFDWLMIGLVAGVLGKLIMPGRDPGGFVVTILLGMAGALLAGYVSLIAGFGPGGWVRQYGAATIGAVVILGVYRLIMRARRGN
jgi:uncharacterized membrane protein YeaQ/YmgE (transglycosylase-associated protein family)